MVDLAEFVRLSAPRSEARACPVAGAHGSLAEGEVEQLVAACRAPLHEISNQAIRLWLVARGVELSWQSVRSHRSGVCRCGRSD